jgi:hypothetical protein
MPYFRVILQGRGVHIPATGEVEAIVGFYTTRVVRADSAQRAEAVAAEMVSNEWATPPLSTQNKGKAPELVVEQVFMVSALKALTTRNKGFTFYSQE